MEVQEVPRVLFQEFSQKLGQGEQRSICADPGLRTYLIKELNPAPEAGGFPRAIGFAEGPEEAYFVLWPWLPRGTNTVLEPQWDLMISAGPSRTGEWAYGAGNRMREMVVVKLSPQGLDLTRPGRQLISQIIQRASELALATQPKEYWEKDRYPAGKYTVPSH